MTEILTKEIIEQSQENDIVSGLVYLRYLKKTISAKNTPYLFGEIESKEKFPVVMWSKCKQYTSIENTEIVNCLVEIEGIINEYGGKKSIQLTNVTVKDHITLGINLDDLKCLRYDKNVFSLAFLNLVKTKLSDKAKIIFDKIFEPNKIDSLWSSFISEYAAKNYHDNCESGLLAHTYKCLRLLEYLEKPYGFIKKLKTNEISNNSDILDLLYLGLILHDVGKIKEMKEGIYQTDSFNSHRVLGLEILFSHKKEIINSYNEHWYQALLSILVGHHNGEGDTEKARTLYAFIIYKIDEMEATFTGLDQLLETSISENIEGQKITWEENILAL